MEKSYRTHILATLMASLQKYYTGTFSYSEPLYVRLKNALTKFMFLKISFNSQDININEMLHYSLRL